MDIARRMSGGHGTGEGHFGLAERFEGEPPQNCGMCEADAVLYFVETVEENMQYACLDHAGAVAYSYAVASSADPNVPASERGADDRRWREKK
jgi:hypothetical protein